MHASSIQVKQFNTAASYFYLSQSIEIAGAIDYIMIEGHKHLERSIASLSVELRNCESDNRDGLGYPRRRYQ